jgi:DNA-binding transcriptional ArsR family regulator
MAVDVFSAIGEPTRRSIVEMLAHNGEMTSTEIAEHFDMSAPAVSQHLKVLRDAHVVHVEKRAQQRVYQINANAMHSLQDWVEQMTQLWEERFDALDRVLQAENKKLGKRHAKKN